MQFLENTGIGFSRIFSVNAIAFNRQVHPEKRNAWAPCKYKPGCCNITYFTIDKKQTM